MFKKLLSNLPFNPSLIGQVSFYAKRLHRESALRRASFIMMALAMVLQMFAVISPPEQSLKASPSTDLINGGFSSKAEAVDKCRRNSQQWKTILGHFGITCENISNATVTNIGPHDYNDKLRSMGRLSYGVAGERPVHVPGVGTLYTRHFWSLNKDPSYKALKVKDSAGRTVFILYSCGNIVSIGYPTPPPPKDVCPNKPGVQTSSAECDVCPNKAGVQTTTSQCDVCPGKTGIQTTQTQCDVCPNKIGVQTTYTQCDVCPNTAGIQMTVQECDVCPNTPGTQSATNQCDVCPGKPGVQTNHNDCKPCEDADTNNDMVACLVYSKSASNLTQNIANANGTTAKPGDTIKYTLTTKNSGDITIKDYQVTEGLADVLDYAEVVDLAGGQMDQYNVVMWPKQEIKAKQAVTHTVTVRIKAVIPQTPASSSDPEHYNMVMTNVYGNVVEIGLPQTPQKAIEIATTTLPNTGPGTALAIGFTLTAFIAYFFARSQLLAKELDFVRADFGSTGGY